MRWFMLMVLMACDNETQPEDTDTIQDTDEDTDTDLPDDTGEPKDDLDQDGFTEEDGDCDDTDATVYPGADDVFYDGVDSDCAGDSDYDADGDGHDSDAYDGDDCQDDAPLINPAAEEICNTIDDNCDGIIDEDATDVASWYADTDGDGQGDPATEVIQCDPPTDYVDNNLDCDDINATVYDGAPIVVCDGLDNDCDPTTIEEGAVRLDGVASADLKTALNAASADATIELCEGEYTVDSLVAAGPLTITGLGPARNTVLDAGATNPLLRASGAVSIEKLTLTGGAGWTYNDRHLGGGLLGEDGAALALTDVIVKDSRAGDGSGIYIGVGGSLTLDNVQVFDNEGIDTNTPVPSGGGIYVDEDATLTSSDTQIFDNIAGSGGGVTLDTDARFDGDGSTSIVGNEADLIGGGIRALTLEGTPIEITGVTVTGNEAASGGGVYAQEAIISDATISANQSTLNGGGIHAIGDVELDTVTLSGNLAGFNGGGVFLSSDVNATLTDCVLTTNDADFASNGGGVSVNGGTLTSVMTDWGEGDTDNTPFDIELDDAGLTVTVDGVSSFACEDAAGTRCTP
ncbi:MAG: putative metal-binding motif-containing protein [Myxococcota bacterium]